MVVKQLGSAMGASFKSSSKTRCQVVEGRVGGGRVVLAVPNSFMNQSGGPAAALASYYSAAPDQLIVVHDEIDLPFGSLRVKFGGGDNGHNGLRSIRSALGMGDWYRVRVGVGRGRGAAADHVLAGFSGAERKELPNLLDRAVDSVGVLMADGLAAAQNEFNS